MRIGFFEVVLIVAVFLAAAFVWRWLRMSRNGTHREDEASGIDTSLARGRSRLWDIGLVLVLAGLGLLIAGYIVFLGLAKIFIWAVAILLIGVTILLLSR